MASIPLNAYGNLPQLDTFNRAACVPTSFANTLAALANFYPSLYGLTGSSYSDLESVRNDLASKYFYTSTDWNPSGSPASLVVDGIQGFAARLNFSEKLAFSFIGPGPTDKFASLANFDVSNTVEVNTPLPSSFSVTVQTPSFDTLVHQRLYRADVVTIQDIKQALDNGDGVVLGMIYRDENGIVGTTGGHAVSAVSLEWTDINLDGRANEVEQARLTIVDPLHPSQNYSPSVGSDATITQLKQNPLIRSIGPTRTTEVLLTSKKDGSLDLHYLQQSIVIKSGKLALDGTDSSNPDRLGSEAQGVVVFAGILNARHSSRSGKITGTSYDDVIEFDPGRNRVKGADGSDLFIVGDPLSLKSGNSDIITDFSLDDGDLIGLRGSSLDIPMITFERVTTRRALNLAMQSNSTIIYYDGDKRGILYSNHNGVDPGFGDAGGELLRFKHSPFLNSTDIHLL